MLKPYAHVIHSSLHENIVRPFSFELTKYADQSKLRGLEAAPVIETLKHLTSCSLLAEATLSHLSKLLHRSVQSMLRIMQSCFACLCCLSFAADASEYYYAFEVCGTKDTDICFNDAEPFWYHFQFK